MRALFISILLFSSLQLVAQRNQVFLPHIRTLNVECGNDRNSFPVIQLGSGEQIIVSFDDMTHEYRRYTYRVEHLSWDFHPTTELFESDYVKSAAEEEVIDDYEESINTVTNYTNYRLTFPNEKMQVLVSGNYRLIIQTEDEEGETIPVAHVYFYVLDRKAGVGLECTTQTDIDWNDAHQQISMTADMGSLIIRSPEEEVKTIVLQNRRWDNCVMGVAPDYINGDQLIWKHNRQLIFPAGNEFRSFEFISTRYPGMGFEQIRWIEDCYTGFLFPSERRKNYLNIDDRNGQFVPRTEDGWNERNESEYAMVHFTLDCEPLENADIYICGHWTGNNFTPQYRMAYDNEEEVYTADLFLKTGYYSYQYLTLPKNSETAQTLPVEGDYWQTENEYTALVYYKRTGDRYWQLVAETSPSFRRK